MFDVEGLLKLCVNHTMHPCMTSIVGSTLSHGLLDGFSDAFLRDAGHDASHETKGVANSAFIVIPDLEMSVSF